MMKRKRLTNDPYMERLISAMNEAAHAANATLFLLLALSTSLLALALSATDEALFRDEARLIPQLAVNLPLKESFAIAPVFFIFIHAKLAVQLRNLRDKTERFLQEIQRVDLKERSSLQSLVFPFAYLLQLTDPGNRAAKLVAGVGIYVMPPVLLYCVISKFIAYRDPWIIGFHLVVWVADILVTYWLLFGRKFNVKNIVKSVIFGLLFYVFFVVFGCIVLLIAYLAYVEFGLFLSDDKNFVFVLGLVVTIVLVVYFLTLVFVVTWRMLRVCNKN